MCLYIMYMVSPIGDIEVCANNHAVISVTFVDHRKKEYPNHICRQAVQQLSEYFQLKRQVFDLPLQLTCTPFQKKVYGALQKIPYGQVCSYQDIAKFIQRPKASRAVGMANKKNPILIIIPCHRVIGKSGAFIGYNKGLDRKEFLLKLEQQRKPSTS